MRYTLRACAAAAVLFAAAGEAQTPRPLTFCADMDNLPMSEMKALEGFEVEFAQALATRLGREARFEWLDPHRDFTEKAVLDGRCDAALGAIVEPGGITGAQPVNGVTLSEPYYRAGYQLIRRSEARPASTLDALRGTRIALEGESLGTITLRQQGHVVHVLNDHDWVVKTLASGKADYGYLWGPMAAWLLRDRSDVVVEQQFQPTELWSFAMAVREADGELRQALNRGIREMVRSGELAAIFSTYRIPYLPPGACQGV